MSIPLLSRVGVVALVPDRWGPHWESRHHILSRLARFFNVIWIEPSGGWRDSFGESRRRRIPAPQPPPGLSVYRSPLWLPRFYRTKWLDDAVRTAQLLGARKRLASLGCSKFVLDIWRPEFLFELQTAAADFSVYHVDDEYSFSDAESTCADEVVLLRSVDQVIVHSTGLMSRKGSINPHTMLISNGVDFEAYSASHPDPSDLEKIPHPRIGYSGYLKRQLNWPLIGELVERHREWSFVFVGAMRPQPELTDIIGRLSGYPNAHFLGTKTAHELAPYPRHFDCCLMPYAVTNYSDCIYPMKLHEYLASGRPVVGAPIHALKAFSHVLELPTSADEWSAAIARALLPSANTPERRLRRQAVARQHDWDALAYRVAAVIARGVGEPFPAEAGLCPTIAPWTT